MEKNNDKTQVSTATYGIMLLVFVSIGRVQELVPYLDKFHIGKIVFGLCIILAITGSHIRLNFLSEFVQIKYVVGIFICIIISIPFGYWPGGSLEFITEIYIKTLIFFFLFISIVNNIAEIHKVIWAVIGSVFILSFTVLITGSSGRLSASSTYDPNDLAFVLVTFMPIVYYFMKEKTGVLKILLQGILVMMLIAFLSTVSRGGFVGLIVIIGFILVKERKHLAKVLFTLIVLSAIVGFFAPKTFWERMSTLTNLKEDYNMMAGGGRVEVWKRGLMMMVKRPLTGVGIHCFEMAEGATHTDPYTGISGKWHSAHNSFVQIGAELGVIALVLFVKLLTSSIKGIRACRNNVTNEVIPHWLLNGTEVAFYGYISTGFFLTKAHSSVLYLLIAIVVVIKGLEIQALKEPHLE